MANASIKIGAATSEFKSEMKACAQSMKDIQTEYSLASQKAKLLGDTQAELKAKVHELTSKIDTQKEKINANTTYAQKLNTALKEFKDKEQDLKAQITNTALALEESKDKTGENSEVTKELSKELEDLEKEYSKTKSSIESTTKKLQDVEKQTEFATKELNNMETELEQVQTKLSTLKLEKLSDGMQKAGEKITGVGEKLKGVTTVITGVGTVSVKTFADFEAQMSKVEAISGATGEDMEKLGEKAKEMGAKTKFSATESGQAMEYMAMAGWKTNDMLNGIEGIMNLAAASGEDLASTSDIVTDAMTAFGLSASGTTKIVKDGFTKEVANASHFADVLATASSNSNTNVAMLGESFKYVAPVAGSLGYSVEDTAIALGLMANSGIKASQGGTALRTMLTNLAKPTDTIAEAMDYLDISLQNNDGSMKSLMEIMTDLRSSFGQCKMPMDEFQNSLADIEEKYASGELTEKKYNEAVEDLTEKAYGAEGALKAKYAATLAGKEGMSGLLSIISAAPEDFDKLTNAIYDSDGAAEKMANTMMDNLSGKTTIMKSALQGVAITIGEILAPKIEAAVEKITNLADKFLSLDEETQKNIVTIGGIVAAIGPALIIIGKLSTGIGKGVEVIKDMIVGIKNMGGVMGVITSPAAIAVAAIAGITAVILTLWNTNEDFRNTVIEIWNGIKEAFRSFADGIKTRLDEMGISFSDIAERIKAIWQGFCDVLAPIIEGAFAQVQNIISTVFDLILGVFDLFRAAAEGDWEGVWNAVKDITSTAWDYIKTTFENVLNAIKGVADVFMSWIGTSWEELWNGVKTFFTEAWNTIKSFFTGILDSIRTAASDAWNKIKETITTAVDNVKTNITNKWNEIKSTITTVINAISSTLSKVWEKIKSTITTVINAISSTISSVWEKIKSTITTVINAISSTISNVWNTIKTTIQTVISAISTNISNVWNSIKTAIETVINAIKSVIETVFNAIKSVITETINGIKTTITNVWNGIKSTVETVSNAAKTAATNAFNGAKTGITNAVNGAKDAAANAFETISSKVSNAMSAAKTAATNAAEGIKSGLSNAWESAKSTTSSVFESIKTTMSNKLQSARDAVGGLIDKIKGKFNFSWSLPKLKLPHLSITGKFSINPPSVPSFSISWYKLGGIMKSPTIFGAAGNTLLAGGEAGAEAILPLTEFYNYITDLLDKKISQMGKQVAYVENYIYLDSEEISGKTATKVNGKLISDKRKVR